MESGQQNHVDSLRIAVRKARDEVNGAALASDAFFPFVADELQRVYSSVSRNSGLKDIHQPDGFSHECVYVLTTPMPKDEGDNPTVEQVRKRARWDNDNYVCRGLILNGMSDSLFDIYQNVETSKELYDTLEAKYMAEDASSKKFLVSNFTNYKMSDSKPILEQYNELLGILGRYNTTGVNVNIMIPKADPNKKPKVTCWKCGKPGHLKKDCKAGNVGNKANGSGTKGLVDGSSNSLKGQNMFSKSFQVCYVTYVFEAYFVKDDDVAWWVDSGATMHMCKDRCWFKTYELLNDGSILHMGNESTALVHRRGCVDLSDLCDLYATLSLGNKKNFVTFIDDTSRFCYVYLLHSNDEALDKFKVFKTEVELQQGSMIKRFMTDKGGKDAIFDENRLSSVFRPSQRSLVNGTEDIGGSVVPEKVTDEEQGMRKKVINDEMDSIMGNNTWVLADLPPGCKPLGYKRIFKRKLKVYGTVEKFKERMVIQGFKQKSGKDYFDTYALVMDVKTTFLNGELDEEAPKQWHQNFDEVVLSNGYLLNQADKCVYIKFDESDKGVIICLYDIEEADVILGIRIAISQSYYIEKAISQLEYSRVIVCLMYAMTCTRPDIVFVVGKLSRLMYTSYPSVLEGYIDVRWISNTEDNSSTSSWVFLLGGGAISWAFKKQTSITGSTMESKFATLATADKAYSQMYNEKSRHLGVRNNMIHELMTNGVVSIEFVRSQQNLADHLTNGLARDLVIKSAEGIGLKHMYLQIILEMCLESAEKEDEVVNFLMVNFF
nr:hypothetical protein [Tanacetum cinerariifolium]